MELLQKKCDNFISSQTPTLDKDNINFYDTFISHFQPTVEIAFSYIGVACKNIFAANGITNMQIEKLGKLKNIKICNDLN